LFLTGVKISAVEADGNVKDLVTGLPSHGDHYNNEMTVGPDGKIYFGQGTASNSRVVGIGNAYPFVWLFLHPDVSDVPAKDIRLTGECFLIPQPNNVLSHQGKLVSF
jgi:glucose/arabinose dehydrogenase